MFCNLIFVGSATRLKAHILGSSGCGVSACPHASEDAKNAIIAAEGANPSSNKRKQPPASFGLGRQPGIAETFKRLEKTDVDQAVANWYYANGIAFNTMRYFKFI